MATLTDRFRGIFAPRDRVKPMTEQGVAGFAIYGGYIATPETNQELLGLTRWRTAADIIANTSIVAASLRYTLNLISRPHWRFDPPDDSAEAKAMAEFAEEIVNDLDTSWTRTVRRAGMFRFHGFGIHEWVGKRRDDGRIGLASLEVRPQHTIERWDIDDSGSVIGVWQRDPQNGNALYLPRQKLLYLVDDTLTDRPDGQGWFRHLVEPARRMKSLLELEAIGFERDLAGIPMGRAPIGHLQKLLSEEKITQAQYDNSIRALSDMVKVKRKSSQTGMILDSATYLAKSETGESISAVPQWDLQLLTGTQNSIEALGASILRLAEDMAMIMGTESMLVGRGGEGSRALSEDKSRNLYLTANATLADMAEGVDRDIIDRVWALNGLDEKLKPKAAVEDVAFKDAESIARVLAEMATAGAVLAPDDPAINDLRDLMGIEHASPLDMTMINALQGRADPTKPSPEAALNDQRARDAMDREDKRVANDNKGQTPPGKTPAAGSARKAEGRTLYVMRHLTNPEPFIEWAKGQGFAATLQPEDLHVTVAHSSAPVDWTAAGDSFDTLRFEGGDRTVAALGDKGAAVLKFEAAELSDRWQEFRDIGASWDFPSYQPHVSISYKGADVDLSAVVPYDGPLEFGPEEFSEVDDDWADKVTETGD